MKEKPIIDDKTMFEDIQRIAMERLEESGVFTAPVMLRGLVRGHGIEVIERPLVDSSGFIVVDKEDPVVINDVKYPKLIVVKSNYDIKKKRSVIAHEMAHYFLSGKDKPLYAHCERECDVDTKEELHATILGRHLLMPSHMFKRFVGRLENAGIKDDEKIISEISDHFVVTKEDAEERYGQYLNEKYGQSLIRGA